MLEVTLADTDYGQEFSFEAFHKRIDQEVSPTYNIATFHFIPRPGTKGEPFTRTEVSTGIGTYVVVSSRTQAEKRINQSHSEHQFIADGLKKLIEDKVFPQQYIIDWVYTERPACPDVWYGGKFVAKGCKSELEEVEQFQNQKRWDGNKTEPYALYEGIERRTITVYSTFGGAAQIKNAVIFSSARQRVYVSLVHQLISVFQKQYASRGSQEEYDLDEYERVIPERAYKLADDLPSWSDYTFKPNKAGVQAFEKELRDEAAKIIREVKSTKTDSDDEEMSV